MWLADVVTTFVGVLFLTVPFAARFNSAAAEVWTCGIGGILLLLMVVAAVDRNEYQHP